MDLLTTIGTFLTDISDDPIWKWYARDLRDNSTNNPGLSGTLPFCDIMETIEQPDPSREKECPPEKGFALISLHYYVPWFVGEVRLLLLFYVYIYQVNKTGKFNCEI